MSFSRSARWFVAFVCGTLMVAGCATDTTAPEGDTGSLSLQLVLGDGIVINEVRWTISGGPGEPPMEPMKGTIDTSAPGATASVEVFGLPPTIGQDYMIEMEAEAEDGTECEGSENFGIDIGQRTEIMVFLNCKRPQRLGAVRVNGKFNICPELVKATASPLETSVGNDIDLSAEGVDADEDDVFYEWSAIGGSIDDPSAEATTYTCQEVGDHMIRIDVTDGDEVCDPSSWTFPVTCVPGDGLECISDDDCDAGEICENNECVPDVECNEDADCDAGEVCENNECIPDVECNEDADCDAGEVCESNECVPDVECNEDADCDAGEMCVENECVECTTGADCADDNECTADICTVAGTCSNPPQEENVMCSQDSGNVCDGSGNCVECNDALQCPGGGECQVPSCDANTCGLGNAPDGTSCNDGAGSCMAGVCEAIAPDCEYEQDFEGLGLPAVDPSALANDGWRIFANVFQPDGVTYIRGYGGGPAPNGGDGYSAVVPGEGGAAQGDQQLSIYGDYINQADQQAGNVIESLVFQERTIVASDVGNTYTFTADFKRGNIEGASTALAFIKTLNPANNFETTNFITENTTNADTTWATLSIQITIDAGLEGQLLQYGFQNKSSNNEGSGIFYDNVSFCLPGNGGGSCVGPALPNLTINGDFETGDLCGWTLVCTENNGACAASTAQANGGAYSGNLVASVPGGGGPASFPLIKQANIGIGTVAPNSPITISFDLFGAPPGPGGVVIAELISEFADPGGTTEILGGGPLFPNDPFDWTAGWVSYTFETTTGTDVGGGVTLLLKADCGAVAGCTLDVYFDNVSVTVP